MAAEHSHHAALSLLSLATTQQSHCKPPSHVLKTPQTKMQPTLIPQNDSSLTSSGSGGGLRKNSSSSPLLYIGVTLERPPNGWGLSLFNISNNYIVGDVQQDVMQQYTRWGWASTTLQTSSNGNQSFRFGPLYPTSLLQLLPGDVLISINGQTQFGDEKSSVWNSSRLNVLAVRLESARRAAQQVLTTSTPPLNAKDAPNQAAFAAYQIMEPLLTRGNLLPNPCQRPCQRKLFSAVSETPMPPPNRAARVVSEESLQGSAANDSEPKAPKRERSCNIQEDVHLPSPNKTLSAEQMSKWLLVRKSQWRRDRAKRRRCDTNGPPHHPPIATPLTLPCHTPIKPQHPPTYRDPLVYLCLKLKRESLETPWGFHVSLNDERYLGVGHVNDAVSIGALTKWGWATTAPSATPILLNTTDENIVRSIFRSKPSDPWSSLCLEMGDFIISVCGRPISVFNSLADVAGFMSKSTELLIIAVRHRVSTQVAQEARKEGKTGAYVTTLAFRSLVPLLYSYQPQSASIYQPAYRRTPQPPPPPVIYRNPLFQDESGESIVFDDNDDPTHDDLPSPGIATDFWTRQGYSTFQDWLGASTFRWKQSYSWNFKKREQLAKEFEEVVHFPSQNSERDEAAIEEARHWLRVRKQQWRFQRRKRQRDQAKLRSTSVVDGVVGSEDSDTNTSPNDSENQIAEECGPGSFAAALSPIGAAMPPRQTLTEMALIDTLILEQERQQEKLKERPPLDISFIFDAQLGAPDEIIVHCLEYLPRSEHGKLLCISVETSSALKERDGVWRLLCPSHWVLPRRPRKRWHEIYLDKMFEELQASRKMAEDVLSKAADILFKQDNLNQIEKLVKQGETQVDFFDVNYISGVIAERNSLLNLAVIYSRHKVARWLVETKGADIESFDRGGFTPLLNAAWNGDQKLVRFLLSHGADRSKIGRFHFFKPLSSPDFKGLDAEGWARKKGHDKLADLIRIGL